MQNTCLSKTRDSATCFPINFVKENFFNRAAPGDWSCLEKFQETCKRRFTKARLD